MQHDFISRNFFSLAKIERLKEPLCLFAPYFLCLKHTLYYISIKRMVSLTTACIASGSSGKFQGCVRPKT